MNFESTVCDNDDFEPVSLDFDLHQLESGKSMYSKSEYFRHFDTFCESIELDSSGECNHFYSEEFYGYMLRNVLPYSPLWSGFIVENQSNALVENYFGLLKNQILNSQLNQKAARCIRKIREYIDSKCIELAFDVPENFSAKRIPVDDIPLAETENWSRKRKGDTHYLGKTTTYSICKFLPDTDERINKTDLPISYQITENSSDVSCTEIDPIPKELKPLLVDIESSADEDKRLNDYVFKTMWYQFIILRS